MISGLSPGNNHGCMLEGVGWRAGLKNAMVPVTQCTGSDSVENF